MLQESASAIPSSTWASLISWFTPAVLFVVLNLMIGTIAVISSFATQKQPQNHDPNRIGRTASVLHRLKSINFYAHYRSHHEPHNPPPIIQRRPTPDSAAEINQSIEAQSQYFFQEFHQENVRTPPPELTETQYVFEQKDSNFNDFEQAHENVRTPAAAESHVFRGNPEKTETRFLFKQKDSNFNDFEQAHENVRTPPESHVFRGNLELTKTQFVFEQKNSNFNDFDPAHEKEVEVEEDDEDQLPSMDEIYSQLKDGGHFSRCKSDTKPSAGELPAKLPAKMKKSASVKSAFGHFEEEKIVEARRPATVRERSSARVTAGDEGVDAKADDFINRFKQQLKLQRLDSILRYKNMIGRGK